MTARGLENACVQLLDLMEVYLRWRPLQSGRTMGYLRIDGSTSLEDRRAAISQLFCRDHHLHA